MYVYVHTKGVADVSVNHNVVFKSVPFSLDIFHNAIFMMK